MCYTNPNKFSYIPSPAGEGGDEENLNKNLLGLVLYSRTTPSWLIANPDRDNKDTTCLEFNIYTIGCYYCRKFFPTPGLTANVAILS